MPPIEGVDPDDAFSLVPYEKEFVDPFVERPWEKRSSRLAKAYKEFRFTTVTTAQFRAFVKHSETSRRSTGAAGSTPPVICRKP